MSLEKFEPHHSIPTYPTYLPTTNQSTTPTAYIPQPEDLLDSMLEPKPPLKPLPDPAFDADPHPRGAPELEPL